MGGGESHLVAVRHVDVILLVLVEGTEELSQPTFTFIEKQSGLRREAGAISKERRDDATTRRRDTDSAHLAATGTTTSIHQVYARTHTDTKGWKMQLLR